jgi:Na+/melibiose symporter-like transporter
LPAIANVLAIIPTWNYAMDTETRNKVAEELQIRRRNEGKQVQE